MERQSMMTTQYMLTRMMQYWKERNYISASEVDIQSCSTRADILGYGKTGKIIETEIKTNIQDIYADRKKYKHRSYQLQLTGTPNKLYYAVPYGIENQALAIIEKINPKYGLIVVYPTPGGSAPSQTIILRCARLLTETIHEKSKKQIHSRSSRHVVTLLQKIESLERQVKVESRWRTVMENETQV